MTSSNSMFNGKLGSFPFVEEGVALRSSKNRPRGARIILYWGQYTLTLYAREEDFI